MNKSYSHLMADRDFVGEVSSLEKTLAGIEAVLNLSELERRATELEAQASAPDLWNDPERAQKVTSDLSRTQSTVKKVKSLKSRVADLPIMLDLAIGESDQSAMEDFAKELDLVTK